MTMLNNTSGYSTTPVAIRRAFGIFAARLGRLINRGIAAFIAHREHQANLVILRSLTDRELRDIGLDRGQIGSEGLAEAARTRALQQRVCGAGSRRR
jgi:uncharacterized protein YjiS (DUF1127 family)